MESAQAFPEPIGRRGWGYPGSRPFVVLTVIALIGAVQALATAMWPPNADTNSVLNLLLGLACLAIALVTMFAAGRVGMWYLNVALAAAILIVSAFALVTHSGQGQMLCGFTMVMLGLFAAYFLPPRSAYSQLALLVVTFSAVLIAHPHLITPLYGIAMVVIIVIVALVVASLVRHLRDEAVHDPLTGTLNRRGLAESAAVAHELDLRAHRPTAVVEMDLNGFKAYNDHHGHAAGDDLLVAVARAWKRELRGSDLLARIGGDEFVVVLPDTDQPSAEAMLTRMPLDLGIAWSSGISMWSQGEALSDVIQRADAALYRNKMQQNS
jgi:diguanylate cyclase (GGDEF)-like protein